MQPDFDKTKSISLVSLLVRSKCFENCNPGSLKQRMVKHGRDIEDNWAKLEKYKRGCVAGCYFAALAEQQLSKPERTAVLDDVWAEEQLANKVVSSKVVDQESRRRQHWSDSMRQKCFDSCLHSFERDHKMQGSCSDGCETFFSIIYQ